MHIRVCYRNHRKAMKTIHKKGSGGDKTKSSNEPLEGDMTGEAQVCMATQKRLRCEAIKICDRFLLCAIHNK
jgi:hypothetical protein